MQLTSRSRSKCSLHLNLNVHLSINLNNAICLYYLWSCWLAERQLNWIFTQKCIICVKQFQKLIYFCCNRVGHRKASSFHSIPVLGSHQDVWAILQWWWAPTSTRGSSPLGSITSEGVPAVSGWTSAHLPPMTPAVHLPYTGVPTESGYTFSHLPVMIQTVHFPEKWFPTESRCTFALLINP